MLIKSISLVLILVSEYLHICEFVYLCIYVFVYDRSYAECVLGAPVWLDSLAPLAAPSSLPTTPKPFGRSNDEHDHHHPDLDPDHDHDDRVDWGQFFYPKHQSFACQVYDLTSQDAENQIFFNLGFPKMAPPVLERKI